MPVRAVVFDIGGVLEITPDTGWQERWDQRLGIPMNDIYDGLHRRGLDAGIGACTQAEWIAGLREITGMDENQTEAFMADLWADYLGELNVEVADYFRSLRPSYKTAMLSNSFLGAREKERERYKLDAMTDFIIYSHEVGLWKPDPRIYALTCERLGVEAAEIVFLDDFEPNVVAARDVGMQAVLFESTRQAIADLQDLLGNPPA